MGYRISIYFLIFAAFLFSIEMSAQAAPTTAAKILVQEPTGAFVTTYGAVKTDISGSFAIPPAGIVKSNGTVLQTATVRTDYGEPTTTLATGILKNTTGTGAHTIAVAADFPVLNQNTTGNAATVTTNANMSGDVTSVGNTTTIAANAVTTAKIADANVTAAKLAVGAVDLASNKVTGITPIANGGTGSSTQTWVDLTTNQTSIAGNKTLTGVTNLSNLTVNQTTQAINANITATATLGATDNNRTIICASACTITLGSWGIGKELTFDIDKTNVGVITLAQSGETINGLSSPTITNNGAGLVLKLVKKTSTTWASSVSLQ